MDLQSLKNTISTFGCKVNTYDTGLLQQRLQQSGLFSDEDLEKLHILNSCAVTHEATKEALRQAKKIKTRNPEKMVILTGCAAQVDGAIVDEHSALDLVIGNSHKAELPKLIRNLIDGFSTEKVHRSNIFRSEEVGMGGGDEMSHSRSFLKIQDGCNSFCSFCVIPFARGKSRSFSINHLIERVHELQGMGYQEVVLTGVHIGDYQDVEGTETRGLEDLVENLLNFTTIPRLRLSSLEPIEISDRLLTLFQNPRLCRHFHISLQSANTKILSSMKRNYTADDVEICFSKINKLIPDAYIGSDVIVGFPGESSEDFQETYQRLKDMAWTQIHVFPYSERSKTRATLLANRVEWSERKRRSKVLRSLSQERYKMSALVQVGSVKEVILVSSKSGQEVQGVSRDYWKVQLPPRPDLSAKREHSVEIQGFDMNSMGNPPLWARWI